MAVAPPARRGPDIIDRQSIPLSATTDQPLDDVPRPPTSASSHPDDLARGVAKEISAEELAAAEAARRPVGVTASETNEAEDGKPKAGEDAGKKAAPDKTDDDDASIDSDRIAEGLPGYATREITKVRNAARQARKEADDRAAAAEKVANEAKEAAEAARKQIEELQAKLTKPAEEKAVEDLRPARDKFDDPDEYDEALTAWGEREGMRKADAKRQEEIAATKKAEDEAAAAADQKARDEAQATLEADIAELDGGWQDQRTKALEKYTDYAEVVERAPAEGGPKITEPMAMAMMHMQNGTDVAYFLGNNTEEAARIAELKTPMRQIIDLARLAERLANPPRRAAPPRPINPIDTNQAPAGESDAEPDMETYAKGRNAALAKERRPFFPPSQVH